MYLEFGKDLETYVRRRKKQKKKLKKKHIRRLKKK